MMRLFVTLIFALQVAGAHAQTYSKSDEIPPLRVSFQALQEVIDKSQKLASAANAGAIPAREEVELRSGTLKVSVSGRNLAPPGARTPNQVDGIKYSYFMHEAQPISRVSFDFSDYRRTITVEGNSPEQVDALFSVVRDELRNLSSAVGGTSTKELRLLATIFLFVWAISWGHNAYTKHDKKSAAYFSGAVSLLLVLWCLPLNDLLAGFRGFQGESSFMVRYGPEMSLVGFLLSVVVVPQIAYRSFVAILPKRSQQPIDATGGKAVASAKEMPQGSSASGTDAAIDAPKKSTRSKKTQPLASTD